MMLWGVAAQAAEPVDFGQAIEQARFFIKKGWWDDARHQLDLAVATEDGRLDPEAWMMLATVAFQLCDLPAARHAADRAHTHSRTLDEAQQAVDLHDWLTNQFGLLTVSAPYDGIVSRLDIVLTSTILDPELKYYISRLRDQSADVAALPVTIGLPAGSYVVNGVDVDIPPGGTAAVLPRAKAGALQAAQVEVGVGPTFWIGARTRGLLPIPTTAIAVGVPLGVWQVALLGAWTPQPFRTATDEVRTDAAGYEIGGRIGLSATRSDPLQVRGSLGYAWGVIPGVALPCTQTDANGAVCAPDTAADLWVYPPARTHQPRAELAILYLDHRRGASIGGGLTTQFAAAFGTVRASGVAQGADGMAWAYSVPDAQVGFAGWSIRSLATLTATF